MGKARIAATSGTAAVRAALGSASDRDAVALAVRYLLQVLADAAHIAAASNVRIMLNLDRVPTISGVDVVSAAQSGEEYELLLTSAIPIDHETFRARFGVALTEIGTIADGAPGIQVMMNGEKFEVEPRGYDHFGEA